LFSFEAWDTVGKVRNGIQTLRLSPLFQRDREFQADVETSAGIAAMMRQQGPTVCTLEGCGLDVLAAECAA
jgi:hypothetical protein